MHKKVLKNYRHVLFVVILLFISAKALAQGTEIDTIASKQTHPYMSNKLHFGTGIYIPTKSIKIRANGSTENDEIDFDETFNLNSNEVTADFFFNWTFSERWLLSAEFFTINTAHKAELKNDIHFGDFIFKQGTGVKAGYKLQVIKLFTGYSFIKKPKHNLGGGIGIDGINLGPYIEGQALIETGDGTEEYRFERAKLKVFAPLPNIGIWYFYSPHPKWMVSIAGDMFYLNMGKYSAALYKANLSLNYQAFKNIGFSAGYRYFNVSANVNNKYWNGSFDIRFHGPAISITSNF